MFLVGVYIFCENIYVVLFADDGTTMQSLCPCSSSSAGGKYCGRRFHKLYFSPIISHLLIFAL